ncbi:MAG: hypothetical protein KGI41_04275, partial [Patescibacteria group bacterium]|nr:hypothetical protein [Patescibacteria group bacterium]
MPDPSLNVHYARFEHARNTADKKYEYPVFMREWIEVKETELGLHVVKLDDVFGGGRAGS